MFLSKKILLLYVLLGLLVFWATTFLPLDGGDFRHNLWAPAGYLLQGVSPYQMQPDGINSVWFPFGITLFLPFGFMPFELAYRLWIGLSITSLLAVIGLLSPPKPKPLSLGLVLLAVFIFPPTVTTLLIGQFSIITVSCLLFALILLQSGKPALAGLLMAVALTKPQLALLTLPVLIFMAYRKGSWTYCFRFTAWLVLWLLLLVLPFFLTGWRWTADFTAALLGNPTWQQPSLYSLASLGLGDFGKLLWVVLVLFCLAAGLYLVVRLKPIPAYIFTLLLTTLTAPYLWSWDFVLILPLYIWWGLNASDTVARLLLWLCYGVAWYGVLSLKTQVGSNDQGLWWLPVVLGLGVVVSVMVEQVRMTRLTRQA